MALSLAHHRSSDKYGFVNFISHHPLFFLIYPLTGVHENRATGLVRLILIPAFTEIKLKKKKREKGNLEIKALDHIFSLEIKLY